MSSVTTSLQFVCIFSDDHSVPSVTISLQGLDLQDSSAISQSEQSKKSHDLDEGIEDVDPQNCDNSPQDGSTGPLRSSHGNQDEIHSMIGDAIHRNFSETGESTNNDSVQASASSSQQGSPDDSQGQGVQNSDGEDSNEEDADQNADDEEYRRYFSAAMHINTETGQRSKLMCCIGIMTISKRLNPFTAIVNSC